ncbi:MAG TPA: single-stranded DNA-binding protein [Oscillatoriaceae cyanobacterium M33_DOE_052]|uniref:Single-stranded DNA-binding protein n=1 Tax=Planktothricoides sp. SpSt-374 TaxID=2282167 RepID=A0A7C3VJD3_9CYAN|nr:single-stranded DNA-binding protein [Oscillatoriaceae cyanobacterium M33_DOE_052]
MNSFVLMAEIIQPPQLRYTSENKPIADMLVEFSVLRQDEQPATLRVVAWGNLAEEMNDTCKQGDRVVIEGRLSMNTVERPEGFREKRAELVARKIHHLAPVAATGLPPTTPTQQVGAAKAPPVNMESRRPVNSESPAPVTAGIRSSKSADRRPEFSPTPTPPIEELYDGAPSRQEPERVAPTPPPPLDEDEIPF